MFNSLQDLRFSQCCYRRFVSFEMPHYVVGWVVFLTFQRNIAQDCCNLKIKALLILWIVRSTHPTKQRHISEDFNLPTNLPLIHFSIWRQTMWNCTTGK